jgi:hypothetical protein
MQGFQPEKQGFQLEKAGKVMIRNFGNVISCPVLIYHFI